MVELLDSLSYRDRTGIENDSPAEDAVPCRGPCDARPGLRERQRLMREEAILDAAFSLIAELGFEAMTMDDLADRASISKPTLYNHFPSKEAIAVRALVRLNDNAVQAIRSIDASLSPRERLERVIRWMVSSRFSPTPAAIARARPLLAQVRLHPDYLRAAGRRIAAIVEIVEAAQAAGDFEPSIPPRIAAEMMFAVACHSEYEGAVADGGASRKQVEDAVVSVFLHGALVKGN